MNNQNVDIMEDRDQQEVVPITVMLPNTGTTKGKRSLQQRDHYIKSGRWKQDFMQKSISAVYLLLFHCLLVSIILVSHCHSDFGTSLQLNLLDPVMASNIAKTKGKRYLQVDHTEDHNNQEMGRRVKSRRWMQVCEPMMIEAAHVQQINNRVNVDASSINRLRQEEVAEISNENVNILHRCDKRIRSNQLSATLLADQRFYADRNSNASSTATIENHDGEQEMQQMSSDENFSTVFDQIKSRTSKRRKQVSRSAMVTENQVAETINQNVSILENHDRLEVAQIIGIPIIIIDVFLQHVSCNNETLILFCRFGEQFAVRFVNCY